MYVMLLALEMSKEHRGPKCPSVLFNATCDSTGRRKTLLYELDNDQKLIFITESVNRRIILNLNKDDFFLHKIMPTSQFFDTQFSTLNKKPEKIFFCSTSWDGR
uniref:Uncharacterized protein n=1 Tax=Rhizophagus irregularis (strain DAOM 181602 / DAOM 197198 / MUCL 43194) TaxID=747089 RepID=U9ULG3_RHIID